MTKSELKERLLSIDLVEDNEFLEKYLVIIINNQFTKHEKFKTQKHHIIPRYYYKYLNEQLDDSPANTVELLYKDHILAHYYLIYCSKHNWVYRRANICAIQRLIRALKKNNKIDSKWIDNLDEIQSFYEESKHVNYFKEDTPNKIRESCKGSIFLYKDGIYKYVKTDNPQKWFNDGWVQQHPPQSEASKQKLREKAIGKIYVHKGDEITRINPSEKDVYLSQGYQLGQGPRKCEPYLKGKIGVVKDGVQKYISKEDLDFYLNAGYIKGGLNKGKHFKYIPRSKESYERIAFSRRGTVAINKDGEIHYVSPEELDVYLKDGWSKGTGVHSNKSVLGKIWVNDGKKSIYISKEQLDEYLNSGWKLGRAPFGQKGGDDLL